jgi:hypothetical protein
MAHYPYVDLTGSVGGCTTELTQIAAASTRFYQDSDYLLSNLYYIGDADGGWSSCYLNFAIQPSDKLPIDNSNCGIKLPIDVKAGDTIKICGIATGDFSDNTAFGINLNLITCGNVDGSGSYYMTSILQTNYTFVDKHVCWSATYTFPQNYSACDNMFTLGFGTQEIAECKLTWTFDLETVCAGPCEFEYTNIASHSIAFTASDIYANGIYYGFSEKCGWRADGGENRDLASGKIEKNWGHNGIKLPVNLIPGDKIILCGTATGTSGNPFSNSYHLGARLQNILCSEAGDVGGNDWPLYNLTDDEYVFVDNAVCFKLVYVVPPGGLISCDTMIIAGFGVEETYKNCRISYTLNIQKPCGSCTAEYTPIAQSSGVFNQNKIANDPLWYIGNEECGWSGCTLGVLQEIQRQEISGPLNVANTNCAIKLPYDLVQGDKIVICGTTTCESNDVSGTGFFPALTKFNCSGYDNSTSQWSVSVGLAFGAATFNFASTACWTLEYVVPADGLLACDTNLLLGLKASNDGESYGYSWTMNIVKLCPGPQEIGCCFTHAKTLFVDPNGNDLTALEGKQTKPWKTIGAAVEYLADNVRTGYTIEVFPGDYPSEPGWFFDFKNTDTTIKLNGNVNIGSANSIIGKGFIQVTNANIKIVGDDRTNSTFAYGGPGAYIQNNSVNDAIIYSRGTTDISISNVSMNQTISNSPGLAYEDDTIGGKLTLNEVSLLSIIQNIHVRSCDKPPVINIKDSVLYTGVNDSTAGYENLLIESVNGSYNPATWIFIENSRLVINGYGGAGPISHIQTDCFNSGSIRAIFNGVIFYWKTDANTVYIWRDNSGQNINVEIINPVVTDHDSWAGSSSFNMITGFGLHTFKGLLNPSLYDG